MPTIPKSKMATSQLSTPQAPNVQRGAAIEGAAQVNLGKAIERAGSMLSEKRAHAESLDFGLNASREYQKDLAEKKEDMLEEVGPQLKPLDERLNDFAKERLEKFRDQAPFPGAFGANFGRLQGVANKAILDAGAEFRADKAKTQMNNINDFFGDIAVDQTNSPNPVVLLEQLDDIDRDYGSSMGVHFNPGDRKPFLEGKRERHVESMVEGMLFNNQAPSALKLLEGKDNAGIGKQMIGRVSPELIIKLKRKTLSKIKQNGRESSLRVSEGIRDLNAETREGIETDPKFIANLELQARKVKDPARRQIFLNDIELLKKQNSGLAGLHDMDNEELDSHVFNLEGVADTANERRKLSSSLEVGRNRIKKERAYDPGGYIIKHNQREFAQDAANFNSVVDYTQEPDTDAVRASWNKLSVKSKSMGLKAMLPVKTLYGYASRLDNGSEGQINATIKSMKLAYGDDFNEIMTQVDKVQGFGNKGIVVAGYMGESESSQRVIKNMKNRDQIESRFKLSAENVSLKEKIPTAIDDNDDYIKFKDALGITQNDNSNVGFLKSMREQISLNTKSLMSDGEEMDDAVEKSVSLYVNTNFSAIEESNSHVLIPNVINGERISTEAVRTFIDKNSLPENLKKLNIDLPPGRSPENTYEFLSDNARWEVAGMNRLRLVYTNANGQKMGVSSGGEPLEFDLKDIGSGLLDVRQPGVFKFQTDKLRIEKEPMGSL